MYTCMAESAGHELIVIDPGMASVFAIAFKESLAAHFSVWVSPVKFRMPLGP